MEVCGFSGVNFVCLVYVDNYVVRGIVSLRVYCVFRCGLCVGSGVCAPGPGQCRDVNCHHTNGDKMILPRVSLNF